MNNNDYTIGFDKGYRDGHLNKNYCNTFSADSESSEGYREGFDVGEEDYLIERGY